jgi:hypothetical protein
VQSACSDPFPDLLGRKRFHQAATVEHDHLNFGMALRTPGQSYLCPANDHERLSLDSDSRCLHGHGTLHASIAFEFRLAASCSQSGLQVFKERVNTSYKIFHPCFRVKAKGLRDALASAWAIQFSPMSGTIAAESKIHPGKFRLRTPAGAHIH